MTNNQIRNALCLKKADNFIKEGRDSMRINKKAVYILIGAVLLIAFTTAAFLFAKGNIDYYTQIDNRWATEIAPHGNMHYKYTLDAYDEKGSKKALHLRQVRNSQMMRFYA